MNQYPKSIGNPIQPAIPNWVPEILTTKELILDLAQQLQCRPRMVYDILVKLEMIDPKGNPATILLERQYAFKSSDLFYNENAPEGEEETYLMTRWAYDFIMPLVKEELPKDKLDQAKSSG